MMPEGVKIPQRALPISRAGAGDSAAERGNAHVTPPKRVHPAHPKKQLFSAPVNKFTAKPTAPSSNLVRIRTCLNEYLATPTRPVKIGPKAVSMEDLTPTKRIKKDSVAEEEAAARIGRFMLVVAWRRRRGEIRCLRKTLEFQVTCSERLRIQVCALKSLLDSDNAKVRLAMRELERLKQLLRDKDMEKALLAKVAMLIIIRPSQEKFALEQDVCSADDRASEMSIGWRNCRNELESARVAAAACERALCAERAATADARAHCARAFERIAALEDDVSQREELLVSAQAQTSALRCDRDLQLQQLERVTRLLELETEARERCAQECSALSVRVALSAQETSALRAVVEELRAQLQRLDLELKLTREQLDWWPRPLTKMLGAARMWIRCPLSISEAMLWSFIPARHGC